MLVSGEGHGLLTESTGEQHQLGFGDEAFAPGCGQGLEACHGGDTKHGVRAVVGHLGELAAGLQAVQPLAAGIEHLGQTRFYFVACAEGFI
ncbi:hypothetical protein D3C86_1874490 [compost metagenome]